MVDAIKLKAIIALSLLVVAIGVPAIYYAAHMEGERNAPPVAVIDSPDSVYVNETVKFSALKSRDDGHITTYLWDFGDGTKSAGSEVKHRFTRVGVFTVSLTVYDNEGANSTATKEIRVEEVPTKEVNVGVDELLSNVSSYIGLEVKVRGIFAYGRNYSFYMVNSSGFRGIRVYVEPGAPRPERMEYGDAIEVRGRFTVYQDELEIKVENNSKDYVMLLGTRGENSYASIDIGDWEDYNNSFVSLSSVVTDVYVSYKYVLEENITVYVSYGANQTGSPAIGDTFQVRGFLTYYHSSKYNYGYMEIYVRNNSQDFSKYVSSNYTTVDLGTLLNSTLVYNKTAVHIPNATVVDSYASWSFDVGYGNRSIHIYVEKGGVVDGMVFNGATVELWGTVTLYHGTWEVKVRNATMDRVLVKSTPNYRDVPVEELLANPEAYNGSNVHSWGIVSWLYRNYTSNFTLFGLYHNSSEITVVGFNGSNMGDVQEAYYADVYAEFTSYNNSWELKVRPYSYDYVYARPQSYQDVNITELLNNAPLYNNTLVHVPWAIVKSVYNASWLFWVSNSSSNDEDMSVYVEKGASIDEVFEGASVEIWGMVTQYKGDWEFKIRNATNDTVKVLNKVVYVDVNITELLNNASKYNNTNVHIPNATVVSVKYDYLFWVSNSTDNSDDISVYIQSGVDAPSVGEGDILELYGNVTYYNGEYEILLRSGTPDRAILLYSAAIYANFSYIHEVDSNGTLVHDGRQVIVNGTVLVPPDVYSYTNSQGTKIMKFYIQGSDGGVQVFGFLNYSRLNLKEGDYVSVRGTIDQYNGEAELKVSTLDHIVYLNHTGNVTARPLQCSFFSDWNQVEEIEGTLVKVNGTIVDRYNGSSFVKLTINDTTGQIVVFIRNSWGINTTGLDVGDNITVTGIVGQYDSSSPYTSGYEIFPRYQSDIVEENSTKSNSASQLSHSGLKNFNLEVLVWKIRFARTAEDTWVH